MSRPREIALFSVLLLFLIGDYCVILNTPAEVQSVPGLTIADMISRINELEIYNTVYHLQNFTTRAYGYLGNAEAATYLYSRLDSIPGLEVEYQGVYKNVIATLPGNDTTSNAVYMVGAHYDSKSSNPNDAPGATDDGGGCAIVLELARIMSQYNFRNTVKFAFWNREEDGCLGSQDYAKNAMPANLKLYFNFDSAVLNTAMMLDIMYDNQSVADMLTQQNNLYGIGLQLNYNGHFGYGVTCTSDYVPFKNAGKTWVMTHQQVAAGTPTPNNAADHEYQHTPYDTIDKVSTAFAKKNAQLGMSTIVKLAEEQSSLLVHPWDTTGPTEWVPDGKCDIRDLAIVAKFFGSVAGDGRYDRRADITGPIYLESDGKIDIRDMALVAIHFGETYL